MKPELKALWKAVLDTPVGDPGGLHWRGDELWCGPVFMGQVLTLFDCGFMADGKWDEVTEYQWTTATSNNDERFGDKFGARAALEAAARYQINEWFKEQGR